MASLVKLTAGVTRLEVAGPENGGGVVLVHGMTYPLEVWTPLFAHLVAAGRRVCRYDLWGRGLSELPPVSLTRAVLVQQLRDVIAAAGFSRPVTLVSLSNSDLLVTHLARLQPELVRAIVMLAPSVIDPRTMTFGRRMLVRVPGVTALLRRRAIARMEAHRLALSPTASTAVHEVYDFSIRTARQSPVFARAVASHLAHLPTPREALETFGCVQHSRVTGTALFFSDDADVLGPRARGTGSFFGEPLGGLAAESASKNQPVPALARHWPDCSVRTLAGTHMGLLENPAPVNAAVAQLT